MREPLEAAELGSVGGHGGVGACCMHMWHQGQARGRCITKPRWSLCGRLLWGTPNAFSPNTTREPTPTPNWADCLAVVAKAAAVWAVKGRWARVEVAKEAQEEGRVALEAAERAAVV